MAEPPLRKVTTIADVANNADGVMRVAFIGACGCGKSTIINALLATSVTKSALSGPAQCRDPQVNNGTTSRVTAYLSGSQGCTLIDTVGFTDPRFTRADLIDSMYQTLYNSRIGFSHLVVVVANHVFAKEVCDLIDVYEKLFGSDFYNRAMLAVTHYDGRPKTLAAFMDSRHSPEFIAFIRKFGDRVVVGSFQTDEDEEIDTMLQPRRQHFKEAILHCLEGMPSRELTLQLKSRNIREFFIWVLDKLRISGNKPEQQKIYEAFALNAEQQGGKALYFSGCTDPVCLEVVENDFFVSPCMHVAHFDCIRVWLIDHNTCPICRHPITTFVHLDDDTKAPSNQNGEKAQL
eukprot:m51a1_g995 hypothetical protein (347) ;mRNA; f:512199-513239